MLKRRAFLKAGASVLPFATAVEAVHPNLRRSAGVNAEGLSDPAYGDGGDLVVFHARDGEAQCPAVRPEWNPTPGAQ